MKKRRINLSRLPPEKRKAAWDWLRREHPDLAGWLQRDDVKRLRETFDAQVLIEFEEGVSGKV